MNEQLRLAEDALRKLLDRHEEGVGIDDVLRELGDFGEPELRAAAWILKARGVADFSDGRLKALNRPRARLREHAAVA